MKSILRTAAAGVAIASFGIASAASAATTDSADVTAQILTALSVDVDPTDDALDFGTVADGGILAPTTVVVGNDGALASCGVKLVCGGTTDAPTFTITGLAGKAVDISIVNATETLNYVGTPPAGFSSAMTASTFTLSKTTSAMTTGTDTFTLGGTLTVGLLQAPGTYAGSVSVSVAYQ